MGDAPHLHPRSLLLLPAGAVGAVSGAAIKCHHQAHRGEDENQQQDDGSQTDRQQEVRGRTRRGQLQEGNIRLVLIGNGEQMWLV